MQGCDALTGHVNFEQTLDGLTYLDVDDHTKMELTKRRDNVDGLKQYVKGRVLVKKETRDGLKYEFLPGARLYRLMLELEAATTANRPIIMLPFPHPMLTHFYGTHNPGITL